MKIFFIGSMCLKFLNVDFMLTQDRGKRVKVLLIYIVSEELLTDDTSLKNLWEMYPIE